MGGHTIDGRNLVVYHVQTDLPLLNLCCWFILGIVEGYTGLRWIMLFKYSFSIIFPRYY